MYEFLFDILGNYAYQFLIQIFSSLIPLIAVMIFTYPMKRRKLFFLELFVGLLAYIVVFYINAILLTDFDSYAIRVLTALIKFLLPLGVLFLCYNEKPSTIVIHWCAGCAAGQAAAKNYSLVLIAFGRNPAETINFFPSLPGNEVRDWLLFFEIQIVFCVVLFLIFGRSDLSRNDTRRNASIAILTFVFILISSFLNSITREYQFESFALNAVTMMYDVLISIFILFLRSGIISLSSYRQEVEIMEQVMYEERKQYRSVRDSMNVINMKCHDLKHQLTEISGKLTEQEIEAMRDAIQIYENNIKTGNEVLDVIVYQKQLLSQREDIKFTCMANGSLLGFMRTTHIYALFNNAIDNAFEAVRKIENHDKRVVSLSVMQEGQNVKIEVVNYFDGKIRLEDGLPATSKDDQNRHGFGVMSIRYIAELYDGSVDIDVSDGVFTLSVSIPIQEKH